MSFPALCGTELKQNRTVNRSDSRDSLRLHVRKNAHRTHLKGGQCCAFFPVAVEQQLLDAFFELNNFLAGKSFFFSVCNERVGFFYLRSAVVLREPNMVRKHWGVHGFVSIVGSGTMV